jgi:hypothetical protein
MIPKLEKGSKLINITIEIVGCIALSFSFNPSFGTNVFKSRLDTKLMEFKCIHGVSKILLRSEQFAGRKPSEHANKLV